MSIEGMEMKNAKIANTMLGREDHGIMSFYLNLDYGGSGQGAGGWCLDTPVHRDGKFSHREGCAAGMDLIGKILETLEVETWEKLPGTYCRVRASWSKVQAIGHPLKDKWLDFEQHFLYGSQRDRLRARGDTMSEPTKRSEPITLPTICRKCGVPLRRLMLLAMLQDAGARCSPGSAECEHEF
jgi:hypothetical protein